MMTEPIETLLFDFGGTLDADGVAWQPRFYAHYRAEGLEMAAADFAPVFHAADDALVGALPREADLEATVERLAQNLEAELARGRRMPGVERPRGRRIAARFLGEAAAAFARNRPHLEALAGRFRLAIVSNFYGNLEAVCRSTGLASLFDVIVDSHRVGAAKPDPAIFRAALAALSARPETSLMIGDSLARDGEGARRSGIGFVWLTPRAEAGKLMAGQERVARLAELAEVLHGREGRKRESQGRHHRRRRG